eukprot:1607136-Pyramimonas_sp.AAC.1
MPVAVLLICGLLAIMWAVILLLEGAAVLGAHGAASCWWGRARSSCTSANGLAELEAVLLPLDVL